MLTDKTADPVGGTADLPELRSYIRSKKVALAGFMELGARLKLSGRTLKVISLSDIFVRYLNDNKGTIAALASEFYGRRIEVELAPVAEANDDWAVDPARYHTVDAANGSDGENAKPSELTEFVPNEALPPPEDSGKAVANGEDDAEPAASNETSIVFCTKCDRHHLMDHHATEAPAPKPEPPNRAEGLQTTRQQRKSKLKAALWYAKRGLAVVPCHWIDDGKCSCRKTGCEHPGKHPITKFGLNDATTNPEQIKKWWRRDRDANIAINCGASGLVVIDVDPRHGGDNAWAGLVQGFKEPLPDTVHTLTPSGGFHLWFRPPPDVKVTGSIGTLGKRESDLDTKLGSGIDVKAAGGYVLCPPDNHLLGEYRFAVGYGPHEIEIAEMPAELVAAISANTNGAGNGPGLDSAAILAGVPEGERDHKLYKFACKLRGAGIPRDFAIELILKAAANCKPPFPSDRAIEKVNRAYKKYPEGEDGYESWDFGENDDAARDSDWPGGEKTHSYQRTRGEKAVLKEPPRPLHREIPQGDPYPVLRLGELGAAAAENIHEATRAPMEICAQSTLATMSLAVMGHVDIELPTGAVRPSAEYFATIADSGERKSSADDRAVGAIKQVEADRGDDYREALFDWTNSVEAWEKCRSEILNDKKLKVAKDKAQALQELGPKPEPPVSPMLLAGGDPTVEGLIRLFREGGVSIAAMFTDEGGQFVGGHAMNEEARLRTAASLSKMWDGEPIKRVRGGDGFFTLKGRRLAAHLLFQPEAAQRMFGDPVLRDQGLLTRFLTTMPARAAGTRQYIEVLDFRRISSFSSRAKLLLDRPFTYIDPQRPREGLKPAVLKLSVTARQLWIDFAGHIEGLIGTGRPLDAVVGLANKAPEHAARLAATIAYFEGDCDTQDLSLSGERMLAGIELAQYYLGEALRIQAAATIDADLRLAVKLLEWLQNGWQEPNGLVSLPDVYRLGPYGIRDKEMATRIVAILEDHGSLESHGPATVNGIPRRDVWTVIEER